MTTQNSITDYRSDCKQRAQDIRISGTYHPAPKGSWYQTNQLSKSKPIMITLDKLSHLIIHNMRTYTNKTGKKIESGKEDAPLFCPVSWRSLDDKRCISNVDKINAFVLDMDSLTNNDVRSVFSVLDGMCYIAYSSYSQGIKTGWTFRIILPVTRPILSTEYKLFWSRMQKIFPKNDIQTKDPSRFWFFPATRVDRENNKWIKHGDGNVIDVDRVLHQKDNEHSDTNKPKPKPIASHDSVSYDYNNDISGQRYKTIVVPSNYPITGSDGHAKPFIWYVNNWDTLPKRNDKYQCYAPNSGTLGSAFMTRTTNLFGVSRYRLTCVNSKKIHLDCLCTDNDIELQYSDNNRQWRYLLCVDNLLSMLSIMDLNIWKCEVRQQIFCDAHAVHDVFELELMNKLRKKYYPGRKIDRKMISDAILLYAEQRTKNTLVDYLESLVWDKKRRIHNTLRKYLKCDNTKLNKIYSKKWMIGAVARALQPGCKLDTMIVFDAPQGHGKGTFIRTLAGCCTITGYSWYNSSPINIGHKDGQSILRTAWIHEMAELSAMHKKDTNVIKNFLSDSTDTFRRAYDKFEVKVMRSSTLVASVNDNDVQIFKDKSGSRRYWYVKCTGEEDTLAFKESNLRQERDQLWAEAVHYFKDGVPWWLTKAEQKLSREMNERHTVIGIHDTLVTEYVQDRSGSYFTVADMIEEIYQGRSIRPITYPNFYPNLLSQLGCILQNDGKRCRRNEQNRSGFYYSPDDEED